jgi:SAM-dependent methyltransferase
VLPGFLPDGIPFADAFDLVCAFDVIEHVEDDVPAVQALAARLAPGGRLLLTLPAHPWLWSDHDVRNHHYRRYTRETLTKLVADAGLTLEKLTAFNSFLFPVAAGVRLAQNALNQGSKAEETMPSSFVNKALEKIFSSEAPIVSGPGFPVGLSLLAILRQRDPGNLH